MIYNELKIQSFRTNDLIPDSGKQVEFGTKWNQFFNIPDTEKEITLSLTFKAMRTEDLFLDNSKIELKLSELTNRNDRKVYANGENGHSQIKDFFLNKLHLTSSHNGKDYFALYKQDEQDYLLFYIPKYQYENFIYLFNNNNIEINTANSEEVQVFSPSPLSTSLQQISYGAPGTGKSYSIKLETAELEKSGRVVRTTFHPDSDYSTFVGAYKPTTQMIQRYDVYQKPIIHEGKPVMEQVITYEFVPQAFLQAYVDAWKNRDPEFLVIEEINRGNCAQIFGDLFQLLDRNDEGFSDYAIRADRDLQKFLEKEFADANIEKEKVKKGEVLLLPSNLYIRATMNTSDQSLFPIDSAFKRRWDWKYVPIKDAGENWGVEAGDLKFDWWSFVKKINEHIYSATNSEDKQLGYFFCKANGNTVTAETFVGKVVFYLWNDVFKDYGFDSEIFNDDNNQKLSFDKFFDSNGNPNPNTIEKFMNNLGIEGVADNYENDINKNDKQNNSRKDKYSINGEGTYAKANVAAEIMKLYLNKNQDHNESKIIEEWKLFDNVTILTQEQYETNNRIDKETRFVHINLNNGRKIYVTNQWSGTSNFSKFLEKMNSSNWPYKIDIVE